MLKSPGHPTVQPSRAIMLLSVGVILFSTCLMLLGGVTSGITWDEEVHVRFLRSYFTNGWNVDPTGVINGVPDPTKIWGIYVYGPVAGLISHVFAVLLQVESWKSPLSTPEAFAVRHIVTSLFGVAGVASVILSIRLIIGSWRWGLVGGAVLSSIPLWTGQSMFNVKDIPVASGYSLATTGIIALLTHDGGSRSPTRWLGWTLLTGGTVIAAGTRMASGVPIAITVVAVAVIQFMLAIVDENLTRKRDWRAAQRTLLEGTACLLASYLVLLLIYPKAFLNPVLLAYEALVVSAKFPFDEKVLTNGVWMEQPVSWSYLPQWFAAQLPLLVSAGALLFSTYWAIGVVRSFLPRALLENHRILTLSSPVILQALLLPLGAIIVSSSIYNGTRQFLFVVPALAILATLGAATLARSTVVVHSRIRRALVWVALGAGMIVPCVAQVQLFPYNYVYFNLPTSVAGIDNRWPTDYWRLSGREIIHNLPSTGVVSCSYEQYRKDSLYNCLVEPPFSTFSAERAIRAGSASITDSEFWYIRENQGDTVLPAGCTSFKTLTRELFFTRITIAQIARCNIDAKVFGYSSPGE